MEMDSEKKQPISVKYRLVGSVQGVGFRHFLQHAAQERQVRGWAQNEQDGSLVVLLFGEESALGEMAQLMRQGPPAAEIITAAELLAEDSDDVPPDSFDMR